MLKHRYPKEIKRCQLHNQIDSTIESIRLYKLYIIYNKNKNGNKLNQSTMAQNMWKIFSLVCSKNPLTRKIDTIKSWEILQNFNFGMLKFDQNTNSAKLSSAKWPFFKYYHSRIDFFANLLSFLLCQFLWWEGLLREQEKTFFTYSGPE